MKAWYSPLKRSWGLSPGDRRAGIAVTHRPHVKGVWYMAGYDDVLAEAEREENADSAASYLEKTKRIKKEEARIKKLFKDIEENRKKLVFTTIADVAFMTVTMQDLREIIIRNGTTATYKNGENQYGTKQSPEAQMYLQVSQKLTQAMKILVDCMPKPEKKPAVPEDDFNEFVEGREDV